MDGLEESLVHCINPGSMADGAAAAILAETAMLLLYVNKDDVDTDLSAR